MADWRSTVVQVLEDLVSLESVNVALPGGARGEVAVAAYVNAFCRDLGLEPLQAGGQPGRPEPGLDLAASVPGRAGPPGRR